MFRIILPVLLSVSAACAFTSDSRENGAAPVKIIDTPDYHGFFMLGDEVLFLNHMPMFTQEDHMYQVILRASLPAGAISTIKQLRQHHPDAVLNLINIEGEPMTLVQLKTGEVAKFNATVHLGYSNENGGTRGPVAIDSVPVTIEQLVFFRHFDYSFEFPNPLRYLIFGTDQQAYMSHLITRTPDFQHILRLATVPDWISGDQVRAGVAVNVIGEDSVPIHCSAPLTAADYRVQFQGRKDTALPIVIGPTVWFSTGNLLNPEDPCPQAQQWTSKRVQ